MPRLGVIGARGRLGSRVVDAATAAGWCVTLTVTQEGWCERQTPDVVVDASHCSLVATVAAYCARSGCGLVEAVSSLDGHAEDALRHAGRSVSVARAPNLSCGYDLQRRAVALAAAAIRDRDWRVVITDRHPATKRDRPSATADELHQVCLDGGVTNAAVESIRSGPPVSEHYVTLVGDGEMVTVTHAVADLRAAASGALHAARWLLAAPPGLWTMGDVWSARPGERANERRSRRAIREEQE